MKMKSGGILVLTLVLMTASHSFARQERASNNRAGGAAESSRQQRIAQAAEALRPQLIAQRRDFHMHPELSNREERTARIVAEKLKALGLDEVKANVARHGVIALLKGA